MKAILISIKPKYVAKILNGEKTLELRKTMPKCDLPIDVYIYCTKDKPYLANATEIFTGKYSCISNDDVSYKEHNLNGKVVAKFTLNKVEKFDSSSFADVSKKTCILNPHTCETTSSCLSYKEIRDYCKGKLGYAWHIGKLVIFDKPRLLQPYFDLDKAPQSWCYIEETSV